MFLFCFKKKTKKTNNTEKEFKKILNNDQKQVNVYQNDNFIEEKIKIHDFVFDFDLIFIFLMNIVSFEM